MQSFALQIIGTHLRIQLDTDSSCDLLFDSLKVRLSDFEQKYSRFIPGNWLDELNIAREAILDTDGKNMLEYALRVAADTDGYFDPTV